MAHVNRLPSGKWRARYRDESGREHSRHFVRKVDAQRWLDEIAASTLTGQYVSPEAGRITFKQFYDKWSLRQLWVSNTRANADLTVSSVPFAGLPMNRIRRSDVSDTGSSWQRRQADN